MSYLCKNDYKTFVCHIIVINHDFPYNGLVTIISKEDVCKIKIYYNIKLYQTYSLTYKYKLYITLLNIT